MTTILSIYYCTCGKLWLSLPFVELTVVAVNLIALESIRELTLINQLNLK